MLPEIRAVLAGGVSVRGVDTFAVITRMQELRRSAHDTLSTADALLTPTVVETFTIAQMRADPLALNTRLGRFTTFTNLLDLCGVALPAGHGPSGTPVGVTVQAVAGRDRDVAEVASAIEDLLADRAPAVASGAAPPGLELAIVGAHLRGMPLHHDLVRRGATLVAQTTTASSYRLFALRGTVPPKPGLRRVSEGGASIEVEVYRLSLEEVGGFLGTVSGPWRSVRSLSPTAGSSTASSASRGRSTTRWTSPSTAAGAPT